MASPARRSREMVFAFPRRQRVSWTQQRGVWVILWRRCTDKGADQPLYYEFGLVPAYEEVAVVQWAEEGDLTPIEEGTKG